MKNIKDLLSRLGLLCRLEAAIVQELEDINKRLYALEENRKQKDAAMLVMREELSNLRLAVQKKVSL